MIKATQDEAAARSALERVKSSQGRGGGFNVASIVALDDRVTRATRSMVKLGGSATDAAGRVVSLGQSASAVLTLAAGLG